MEKAQALLDLLSIQMDCMYLSDLKFLSGAQRLYLAQKLSQLTPREEDLDQWNDALEYLTGTGKEATALAARQRLVKLLSKSGTTRQLME